MAQAKPKPVTLLSLIALCEGDPIVLARQLIKWGLIPDEGQYMCPCCGSPMRLNAAVDRVDGLRWYCGRMVTKGRRKRIKCNKYIEFRTGTLLACSELSIFKILGFVNLWTYNLTFPNLCLQIEISRPTAIDWASFCRELVLDAFITHKEKLGGFGKIVEIYQSKFSKRKYYRGRSVEGQWVFGGYEKGPGRVFMIPVEDRSADTLLPVIRDWIEEGTTIISDYWKANDCLSLQGYEHLRDSRFLNLKDPGRGVHFNAIIQSSLRIAKHRTTSSCGRKRVHIPGNLARYIFYKRCADLKLVRTEEFLRLAGLLYNPLSPREFPRDEDFSDESDDDEHY